MEYRQEARTKNCAILGFFWTSDTEVVFVTDLGVELYSVSSEKRSLKVGLWF